MEEGLSGLQWHEDSTIFETVARADDPDHVELPMPNWHHAAGRSPEKVRSTLTQNHRVTALLKLIGIPCDPGCVAYPRILGSYAKARDDRMIGTRNHAKQHGVGVAHHGPFSN